MWIIDTYRWNNNVVAWYKDRHGENHFHTYEYNTCIYAENTSYAKKQLNKTGITYNVVKRTNAYNHTKTYLEIRVPNIQNYERFVAEIERICEYDVKLYNADIPPAQHFLYEQRLRPYDEVTLNEHNQPEKKTRSTEPELTTAELNVETTADIRVDENAAITQIVFNNQVFAGPEKPLLKEFKGAFLNEDPDAIFMRYAFRYLPFIQKRCNHHGIAFSFHRKHHTDIKYRGGQSFFSYGNVFYRDFAVRLHGRILIDRNTYLGDKNALDGIIELAKLSGTRTQHLASRSFGAVTQGSLVRELIQAQKLVPHKHKPLSKPMRLSNYVEADKGGHYYDPKVGVHEDVAAIDFSSMFPNLICKYNICAEAILNEDQPRNQAPNIPVSMHTETGLLPNVLRPIMNRREQYKNNPEANEKRIQSLKGVLVSSYGYLRYREFKMGLAEAHMAICAYARRDLVRSAHIAEKHGCNVVHGLVDSLYIQKKGVTTEEVQRICQDIETATGLPINSDGILDWVAFLTSKTNPNKPVVTRYFGVYKNGDLCIKGLTAVQSSKPEYLKEFQREALRTIHNYAPNNVATGNQAYKELIRTYVENIRLKSAESLTFKTKIRKTTYEKNCPQKHIIKQLREQNVAVHPGYTLRYIKTRRGVILPEHYNGKPDVDAYTEHLVDAFHELLAPFQYNKETIMNWTKPSTQTKLLHYTKIPAVIKT